MEHECINKELIEKFRTEINQLRIEIEIEKSNIASVKEDIKDMKDNIKEISNNVKSGFEKANTKNIATLTTTIVLLAGVIIDIAMRVFK